MAALVRLRDLSGLPSPARAIAGDVPQPLLDDKCEALALCR